MFTDIEAKDVKRLLLRVYKKYQSGEITENKAQKETYILNSVLKAIEVTDIEARLERIEILMKEQ
jgi:hypothetical protein